MSWQLAKVVRANAMPDTVGKFVWCKPDAPEPCGGGFTCKIPSLPVNLIWTAPFNMGDVDAVMHADCLELIDHHRPDVQMWRGEAWRRMTNEEIIAPFPLSAIAQATP